MAPLLRAPGIGRELMQQVARASLGAELIYSFVIIAISLMIYFGTKELYNLTNHKGIKYFRLAFLCFAVAFFFRSFIKFLLVSLNLDRILELNVPALATFSLIVFMYDSFISKKLRHHSSYSCNTLYLFGHCDSYILSRIKEKKKGPTSSRNISSSLCILDP